MELTMQNLEECFEDAVKRERYIGVAVSVPGHEDLTEVIINQPDAVATKLAYYQKAYTEDLKLKANKDIYLKAFTSGPTALDVARDLLD